MTTSEWIHAESVRLRQDATNVKNWTEAQIARLRTYLDKVEQHHAPSVSTAPASSVSKDPGPR